MNKKDIVKLSELRNDTRPDVLIVKVVPEINAELLEELTFEGIDAL